ncbi:hypothetical protein EJ04DRAFT_524067 [Polyplosphaeria fusca]|uniref:Uncharacterized protein n=1 Tax=Polyplosphaeria fusca TaxID=682080 RepID=A0A9P4QZV0_9PLEO|nr:hypothetical protein EJ04DRAFT_524067 [Polyplosphaeria fusca]
MRSTLLSLAVLATAATAAIPSVKPIPLGKDNSCASWPNSLPNSGTDSTGSIMFKLSSAEDDVTNGLPLQTFKMPFAGSTLQVQGGDLKASRYFAKADYRCLKGQVMISQSSQPVFIAKDVNNAHLVFDSKGYKSRVYKHDGMDGVFLGAMNQTTWGVSYVERTCDQDDGADGWE